MNTKHILVGFILLGLSACASTPKSVPVVDKVTEQKAPPPVFAEPAPVAPIAQETVNDLPAAPAAGTLAHFKYVAGDDRVYFGYNQYDLTPQARDVLRKQAGWLKEYSSTIMVIGGHADERGTREYNLALGARRADTVKAFLVSQGVAPGRITTVSYGKERPIDGGSNEAAWARNRNAHTAVLISRNGSS